MRFRSSRHNISTLGTVALIYATSFIIFSLSYSFYISFIGTKSTGPGNYFLEGLIYFLIVIIALLISNNTDSRFRDILAATGTYNGGVTILFIVIATPMIIISLSVGVSLMEAVIFITRIAAIFTLSFLIAVALFVFLLKYEKKQMRKLGF